MRIVRLRRSVRNSLQFLRLRRRRRGGKHAEIAATENDSPQISDALKHLASEARFEPPTHPYEHDFIEFAAPDSSGLDFEAACDAFCGQDFSRSLFILERLPVEDSASRLLRNQCLCLTGRKPEALLDLYDWSRDPECPGEAVALLALLAQDDGDHEMAQRLLTRTCGHECSSGCASFLQAITFQSIGRIDIARQIARATPRYTDQLARLGLVEHSEHDVDRVAVLANELIQNESILKSLVAALGTQPDCHYLILLAHALERVESKAADRASVIESLATLYLLAGRIREARQWVLRGIRDYPRRASLMLLLLRLPQEGSETENASTEPHIETRKTALSVQASAKSALSSEREVAS